MQRNQYRLVIFVANHRFVTFSLYILGMFKTIQLFLLIAASFVGGTAFAARPMMTDDARIVDPQSCQLESWTKVYERHNEFWALPACNPFGFFELTVGGSKIGRAHV